MAFEDVIAKIADRLPYSDGAARRRFMAGAMLLIGVAVPYWPTISTFVGGLSIQELLKMPLLAAASGLLVYLAGTLIEMVGAIFLVPAALRLFL
jgi:hypothetical protein